MSDVLPDEQLTTETDEPDTDKDIQNNISYDVPEFACWAVSREEMCRAFVFQWYAGSGEIVDYNGAATVRSMDAVYEWLMTGKVPREHKKPFPVINGGAKSPHESD